MNVAPYGSWISPISADLVVERAISLSQVEVFGTQVFWNECRPSEEGRQVIVRWVNGRTEDVIPPPYSARTTVHEYGGGSYAVYRDTVFFSNFEDQRLYRVDPGGAPKPITPSPPLPGALRYADGSLSPDGNWLACVREKHTAGKVLNQLVGISAKGESEPRILIDGRDFFAAPRFSPDGKRLAWLCWDHPSMPWDGTELWTGTIENCQLKSLHRVAGGPNESISQPRWSPDGVLHWISDASGWWNIYREGNTRSLAPSRSDFSGPDWMFGQSTYCFLSDGRILAVRWNGFAHLVVIDPARNSVEEVETPYTSVASLKPFADFAVAIAASPRQEASIVRLDQTEGSGEALRCSRPLPVDVKYLSVPEPVKFPIGAGRFAYCLYYPPTNPMFRGPAGQKPPLISMTHGGPSYVAVPALSTAEEAEDAQGLIIHFWTSRGFAVIDVNYSGSTGYGRQYRNRLKGRWGVADVADCVSAARYLVARGEVDKDKLIIRGGSAGGYVALCALTFHDLYAAGASYFGIADLEALTTDTHKFESRYLDWLIGPYPEMREIYRQRSPINFAEKLSAPLIIFQGRDDTIVSPSQAKVLADALGKKGLPFAYLEFEGEGHGFRRAEIIKRSLEAELWFYGQILNFEPADEIEPIVIENLRRPSPSSLAHG